MSCGKISLIIIWKESNFYTSREKVHDDEFFNDVSVFSDLENATASSWFYEWGCFMFIFHANMKSYFSWKLFNFLLQKNYLKLIIFKIALKLIFALTNFKEGSHKNDMIFTYKKYFINNFKAHFKTTSSSSRRGSTDYWLRMRMEMLWTKKKIVPCRISFAFERSFIVFVRAFACTFSIKLNACVCDILLCAQYKRKKSSFYWMILLFLNENVLRFFYWRMMTSNDKIYM